MGQRERVAAHVAMSHETLRKARVVVDAANGDPFFAPLVQAMNDGRAVDRAYRQCRLLQGFRATGQFTDVELVELRDTFIACGRTWRHALREN